MTQEIISPHSQSKEKVQPPSLYEVTLHNDDYTTMEFVIGVLVSIFKHPFEKANQLTLDIHKKDQAIVGIYQKDIALTKVQELTQLSKENGFPLKATIRKQNHDF